MNKIRFYESRDEKGLLLVFLTQEGKLDKRSDGYVNAVAVWEYPNGDVRCSGLAVHASTLGRYRRIDEARMRELESTFVYPQGVLPFVAYLATIQWKLA